MQAVEIEIDGACNEQLQLRFLERSIRGRFDLARMGEPMAKVRATEWPVLPSQRLGITPDGEGYLIEPLHQPEYAAVREKIEKKLGMKLEPPTQTFAGIHVASWLFWLKRAVESGLAKVVKGQLPDKIDGTPRMNYLLAEPGPTNTDKLTEAMQQQTQAFNRLADVIGKLVEKK